MIIVADSGPIIAFARAGRLDLLKQVTTEQIIPDAVFESSSAVTIDAVSPTLLVSAIAQYLFCAVSPGQLPGL